MEKVKSKNLIGYWGVIGLLVFLILWILPWRFEANDDVIMMWLVSGAYTGTPEPYAVFIHPLLSWSLSKLYTFMPFIQWYAFVWFLVLYASFMGIVISVLDSCLSIRWKNLLLFSFLVLYIHFSLILQFTIVAGVAGFSGFLLANTSFGNSSKLGRCAVLFLLIISILIRWESFALAALGYAFYQFIAVDRISGASKFRTKTFLIIGLVFILLQFFDFLYLKNSGYAEFKHYTKARANVFDHPVFYTLEKDHRLDQTSEWYFFSLFMMDGNQIDVEKLSELKHELDKKLYSFDQIGKSLVRLREVMGFQNFKLAFSLLILCLCLWSCWKWPKYMLFLCTWLIFMLVFNHFFIVKARVYILFFLPLLYFINGKTLISEVDTGIFLIFYLIVGGILIVHLVGFFEGAKRRESIAHDMKVLTDGQLNYNQLIIYEGYQQNFLPTQYNMINPVPFVSMGWISKSPFQAKALDRFGIKKISDASEFYLMGIYDDQDFKFPSYMEFLGYHYDLEDSWTGSYLSIFRYSSQK
ncbi:hypothetical protein [Algoriphagus sp. Y33]|uniref:hypothetical protein n=1 Tax=Algoriphagus sp. Y33 TaxID=2772483 RepID=UPI001782F381|nr:hypothetical protein [Algoriphagus sp. Y33]